MPETKELRLGLSETEWRAFWRWFSNTYGFLKTLTTAGEALRPYIAIWQSQQKPYLETLPGEPYQTPGEKEQARLEAGVTPEIKAGKVSPVELGFPAGKGYEWVQQYDPQTRTTQWVERLAAEVKPEGESRVETINGVLGFATYENGKLVNFEPFPASVLQGAGQAQWRPGELELGKEQFEWQKQQAQLQIAQSYEDWRRRLLSELSSPEDWITRWMVQQTPEKYPWSPPPETSAHDISIAGIKTALAQLETDVRRDPRELPEILPELQRIVKMEKELQGWETEKAVVQKTAASWPAQPTPESIMAGVKGTPPAPSFLPQFVPGLVAGTPITKQFVPTPSGQQLATLAPSQAAGISGFAEWAGGRPWRDILAEASIMMPQNPRLGAVRWSPARQGAA